MSTAFPAGLDVFVSPTASDLQSSVTVPHADQHTNVNDAVMALEATIGITATTVTGSVVGRLDALERAANPLTVTLTGGSNQENGASVASVNLLWAYTGPITSQSLSGTGSVAPALSDRAQVVTGPYTSNTTWIVQGSDGVETDTDTTSLTFLNKRYYGVSALTSLNDAQVLALTNELATSYTQSRSLSPAAEYTYFAWPTAFGSSPTFTVNGLVNTAWTLVTRSFTNASSYAASYDIYRSDNLLTGTYTVAVT